ncbi:hypothetical protein LARV_00646 [Longilinea arvoryzae]|uniref:Uncharacterized protein n=1 Tax=Longilinea arvoryzae TaxID=360412 RepID=A0A0S7BHD8_9CHLR|nr:hypothetical protein [Longilinea arvoryzae]GAP12906.1 hypothetical protein LARV_00646 [Longilinea arvoryzae]
MKKNLLSIIGVAALTLYLAACSWPNLATDVPAVNAERTAIPLVPSRTAVIPPSRVSPSATAAATTTPTVEASLPAYLIRLTNPPKDMESYGLVYDPQATPALPPSYSVDMPIWGQHLPLQVLDHVPRFIAYPPPPARKDLSAALSQADCAQKSPWTIECTAGSPVLDFDCAELVVPEMDDAGLDPDIQLLAICQNPLEETSAEQAANFYRRYCAFRRDVAYIVKDKDAYRLIQTPAELKTLLLPIDTPDQALTYIEMRTGLTAQFTFESDPSLLYFQDPVEGTHITETGGVFTLNMFHFTRCSCEPWVNSVVLLSVDRDGEIKWLGAEPWSMTTGFSCTD